MRIAPLLVENIVGSERAVMRPMTSVGYNFINLNLLECLIFLTIRKERETTVPMKYSLFPSSCGSSVNGVRWNVYFGKSCGSGFTS